MQCPNNLGEGTAADGRTTYFFVTTTGTGSYYTYSGSGALYYSFDAAGISAIENINGTSMRQNFEYAGEIYQDGNGLYSYTTPTTDNNPASSTVDPSAIPDGTVFVGDYHTHGADSNGLYDDENFSTPTFNPATGNIDPNDTGGSIIYAGTYPSFIGSFLGTPAGRVEFYNPITGTTAVLVGPPLH